MAAPLITDIDIPITQELLSIVAEIDEFKGKWRALNTLAPDRQFHKMLLKYSPKDERHRGEYKSIV